MILNISRMKSAMLCWRKTFNNYHRNLQGSRSLNLVDGSAFHKGVALGQATGDWQQALVSAQAQFDEDFEAAGFHADEEFIKDQHKAIIVKMVECYAEAFKDQGIVVLQPECEFAVEIPHTVHNDISMHWLDVDLREERWGIPDAQTILEGRVGRAHVEPDPTCACWQPHVLVGKTDGIIQMGGYIWLQEHKTTSIQGDQFWQQWHIDMQITGYIYGVHKATGMLPKGVILNAIQKPSEGQVANWNSKRKHGPPKAIKDYISYSRDIFLRTEKDLEMFEQQVICYADEWEQRILSGRFPLANVPMHCFAYNRKCDYYGLCVNHDDVSDMETLVSRESDYVDQKREELIQINA